ncbi:PREDICTED: engulfment and cell motility protein 1-like [Thamnophis sirtalis]|uniref:Engulfment and cell motility protein 1-like n=1 Tax=Thamnophis sirtalis TaxID=35019 RepID=A0A6I9X6J6_9SAUR|nr:PREDICTED: engulfment and cell motility protein 1-like [Thamnophis sirtalis]
MENARSRRSLFCLPELFSLSYDVGEHLNFIASTRYEFCLWTDGLNVLLGREMVSERMRSELDILLSMELKLRLLDLENIAIPDAPPDIPKPPSNLNFCYDFTHIEQ